MVCNMLPPEILLNILGHLEGDSETFLSLVLTCKLFRALLTENEPRIALRIALNQNPGPIKILLEATAPSIKPPSFHWLSDAYSRGHAIERLVNALENSGIYKDQSVFGTIFSAYGRPLVPEDHTDVRRYVLTMLLAVELCSVSGNISHRLVWANLGPRWTAGLILRSRDLIHFVVKMLYLVIENHDASTWGPSDAPSGFFPSRAQADRLANYLLSGMLLSGAKGIVDILSTTYECYDQLVAVARQRLFNFHLESYHEEELWPEQQIPRRLWFISSLWGRSMEEAYNGTNTYKDYVGGIDIDCWKSDIINDKAWIRFMHDNGWSKPLLFTPMQLRMKLPKPIFQPLFETTGAKVWNAIDGKRFMAQPLSA
jgi:hypothetical protein